MPTFHNTRTVNASPDKAWAVLDDLAGVDRWILGIADVKIEGKSHRICTMANGAVQHEEILNAHT